MITRGKGLFSRKLKFFVASLTVVLGCTESPTVPISGKVTFVDGAPVGGGFVQFRSKETPKTILARGTIQGDGSYELTTYVKGDGAVRGEQEVAVLPPPLKGDPDDFDHFPEIIMPKYNSFRTSGLKYTVSSGSANDQVDFQVERGVDR